MRHALMPAKRVTSPVFGVSAELTPGGRVEVRRFTPVLLGRRLLAQPFAPSVERFAEIMAAGLVDAREASLIDYILQNAAWSPPTDWWISGFTTAPSADTGAGAVEPVGNGYAREQMTRNGTNWAAASGGDPSVGDNAVAITMGPASGGNWGTLVAGGAHDAVSAGNLWWYWDLAASKTVNDGDSAEYAIGALDFKVGDSGDTF